MVRPRSHSGDPNRSVHIPVMVREVLHYLNLAEGHTVVDGTIGAGGHSFEILKQIGDSGRLIGIDRDPDMLRRAGQRIQVPNIRLVADSYSHVDRLLEELGIDAVDRILVDLGLSSDQLADRERGFGFDAGGSLDLRFNPTDGESAAELLDRIDQRELEQILVEFGEEKFARQIAAALVDVRRASPIRTAEQLADCVACAIPGAARRTARKHPATRVFQALRIAVNQELDHVATAMGSTFPAVLRPGGRLVVISFHSLEDRIVKHAFRRSDQWQVLTAKPVTASAAEQRINPRSRTARLRAAVRV